MCGQYLQHSNHVLSWRVSLCIVFINQVSSSWPNIVLTLGIMRSNVDITQGIVYKSMTNICPSLGRRSKLHLCGTGVEKEVFCGREEGRNERETLSGVVDGNIKALGVTVIFLKCTSKLYWTHMKLPNTRATFALL